jgi:hypothetical protein
MTKRRFDDPDQARAIHKFNQAGSHGMTTASGREGRLPNLSSADYINTITPESEPT